MSFRDHVNLNFLHNRELDELYAHMFLRSFALGLVSIFVPIYLIQTGFSLTQVFLYYGIRGILHSLFSPLSGFAASYFGRKGVILISIPMAAVFLVVLQTLPQMNWPIIVIATISALTTTFFWTGYHTEIICTSPKESQGAATSIGKGVSRIASALAPLIGGLLSVTLGFPAVFMIAGIAIVISGIPLLIKTGSTKMPKPSLRRMFQKRTSRQILAWLGHSIQLNVAFVIWPLYLALELAAEPPSIGGIATISLMVSIAISIILGFIANKHQKILIWISSIANSTIWIIKPFIQNLLWIFPADASHELARTTSVNTFNTKTYLKARKRNVLEDIMFREMVNPLGGTIMYLSLALLVNHFDVAFAMAAIGSLMYLLY